MSILNRAARWLRIGAWVIIVSQILGMPPEAAARPAPDDPARSFSPTEIVSKHVLPNVYTKEEHAEVEQVTRRGGDEQTERFVRRAEIGPDEARVLIEYRTGTHPIYTDTIRGAVRRQEYRVSPNRPTRRVQTPNTFAIKGSACSFRDLHWRLERYRWIGREDRNGHLRLLGENGPYARLAIELDRVLGALVVTRMEMFDPAERLAKVQALADFVRVGSKVRPTRIRMTDLGSDEQGQADDVVTTLRLTWNLQGK